ncbi:Ms4527A family Cys-rich leader peptide [Mycolicibacterium fortuitum]|uniref:Ms4527A family Cys-rich leader peptide n=1 Tax=Mycolicibacterium fortuitum TaxID=1766 RepID=UPI003464CB3D
MDVDPECATGNGRRQGLAGELGARGHGLIFPDCPARTFAHPERKYGPVRAGGDNRGRMSGVTAAHNSTTRIALVARRHVDFKRVCSCCCLP